MYIVDCSFEIRIYYTNYNTWEVCISKEADKQAYTCNASPLAAFLQYWQSIQAQIAYILSLYSNIVALRFISATLLEEAPRSIISLWDIYNIIAHVRKERLEELTLIKVLIKELYNSDDWASRYCTDSADHVNFLFFTLHTAIELAC